MVQRSSYSKLSKLSTFPGHETLMQTAQNLSNVDNMVTMVEENEQLNDSITAYLDALCDNNINEGDESSCYGDESSCYGDEPSDHDDGFLPASPIAIPSSSNTKPHPNSSGLTMRDSLLAEAWNRKKELAFQGELSNLNEHSMPHLLGRSSSDCGATAAMRKYHLLNRSASDVGKNGSHAFTRTRTRSLTDDDFEELKGFIDLGFRFDETSLPAFSHTLPALEVYCAVAQSLQESPYCPSSAASPARLCTSPPNTPQWRVCSPGDSSEEASTLGSSSGLQC
ncbi:hypothetical protein L7F22_042907 [Adiantum nelumboides]|nr:hypothetical protein [Adiantum nelumboides]